MKTKDLPKYQGLTAPVEFWELTEEQVAEVSNGCGPVNFGWLVPDNFALFRFDFGPGCDIHDVTFQLGYPKTYCDLLLRKNLLIVANRAHFIIRPLARVIAEAYYRAVRKYGERAYAECERLHEDAM